MPPTVMIILDAWLSRQEILLTPFEVSRLYDWFGPMKFGVM